MQVWSIVLKMMSNFTVGIQNISQGYECTDIIKLMCRNRLYFGNAVNLWGDNLSYLFGNDKKLTTQGTNGEIWRNFGAFEFLSIYIFKAAQSNRKFWCNFGEFD